MAGISVISYYQIPNKVLFYFFFAFISTLNSIINDMKLELKNCKTSKMLDVQ